MLNRPFSSIPQFALSICFFVLIGTSLADGAAATSRKQRNLQADSDTCVDFGTRYGTPAYSECMLTQQRRRDDKQLDSLQKTKLTSEIALEAQIMSDRARKQRCERKPSRRECRR